MITGLGHGIENHQHDQTIGQERSDETDQG